MECADTLERSDSHEIRRAGPRQSRTTSRATSRNVRRPFPRTRERMRRARRQARSLEWAGPWGQFAGRVYDALEIDLDNHEDDDALAEFRVAQRRREEQRNELQRWQQRINIANRLGAGEIFASSLPRSTRQQLQHHPETPPPVQETRDELRSWGAFERARLVEEPSPAQGSRKRRAPTASPIEPSQEPERKLKRPRTRRFPPAQGEASGSKSTPTPAESAGESASSSRPVEQDAPSFLSALLKEVGAGTPSSDDENVRGYFARSAPDATSPATSPAPSPHNSPRALSLTPPPPMSNGRPGSPTLSLSSYIEPRYPRANYSPTRQPTSPSRQSSRDQSDTERKREKSPEASAVNMRTLEIRQPRPRRPQLETAARSMDASSAREQLSPEAKASINGIVRTALKPHWHAKELTTEQYSSINRDVSRKLYEEIKNPAALDDDAMKSWEMIASREVAQAVSGSKATA